MEEVTSNTRERQQPEKPGNGSAVVVISELVKRFGKLRAINNLNMTINTGETFGLIGPNGSGKTTLIRMLVGLMRPTRGTIRIMGLRMPNTRIAPHIGYMTQL